MTRGLCAQIATSRAHDVHDHVTNWLLRVYDSMCDCSCYEGLLLRAGIRCVLGNFGATTVERRVSTEGA